MFFRFVIVFPSSIREVGEFNFFIFFGHITSLIPIHIALELFLFSSKFLLLYLLNIYYLISIFFKRFASQPFCYYVILFDHYFVKIVPDNNRFSYSICNLGLGLSFFFFTCWFSNWCMSLKGFIEKQGKSFKLQVYIIIFCGKVPVYFLQIPFERVSVKISKVSSVGSIYSFQK